MCAETTNDIGRVVAGRSSGLVDLRRGRIVWVVAASTAHPKATE
jgi:hypothetical protein